MLTQIVNIMAEDLLKIVHIDGSEFGCVDGFDPCTLKERTQSFALFVDVPTQNETPEEVFKECCYVHRVLASATETSSARNDFSGFFHQRQVSNESCDFILVDLSDNSETILEAQYGTLMDFGTIAQQPNLKTYRLDWRKVLLDLGEGSYKVLKRFNLVGLTVDEEYLVYNLQAYGDSAANGTIRIDVTMSGLMERLGIDFSGTDFATSLRLPGFFGRREPTFEEDNIVSRSYQKRQVSMKQTNEYKLQTNMVPDCITNEVIDFMLFSDDIRVFDYNLNNHSYDFKNFPVKLENNEGTRYITRSRKAQLNLVFSDKTVDNNKRNY